MAAAEHITIVRRSGASMRLRLLVAARMALVACLALTIGPEVSQVGAATAAPFVDVDPSAYYAPAVEWARAGGVTSGGADPSRFYPQSKVTRAQAITFLWRSAGSPASPASAPADVPRESYYAPAADWAFSEGIATGAAGTGLFRPNRPVSRAQSVAFLWRWSGSPVATPGPFTDLDGYEWAKGAIDWARAESITTGVTAQLFEPAREVTRAEAVAMLWRAIVSPPASAQPPSEPVAPPGWHLVWSDEFATGLDNAWHRYHSTYGDGNHELQCLTPDNVGTVGGNLRIQARREVVTCPNGSVRQFSSGFISTRETGTFFPRYGRFEIRARVPHGQGIWPAFWLRHRDGAGVAEVDVMEYFHSQVPGRATATLHLDGRTNLSKQTVPFEAPTASPGWHNWAVEIDGVPTGVRFTFLLDGVPYHSYTDTQHRWAAADPAATWDMALNVAVGGSWVGHPDDSLGYLRDLNRCAQGGIAPLLCRAVGISRAVFPSTFEVDYVRVFSR